MRRRDIQSFTLKLSDLKEYEQVRQDRSDKKSQEKPPTDGSPIFSPQKYGPKTKQEIRERIGLKN